MCIRDRSRGVSAIQGLLVYWNIWRNIRHTWSVCYIVGVRSWGVSVKRGSTVLEMWTLAARVFESLITVSVIWYFNSLFIDWNTPSPLITEMQCLCTCFCVASSPSNTQLFNVARGSHRYMPNTSICNGDQSEIKGSSIQNRSNQRIKMAFGSQIGKTDSIHMEIPQLTARNWRV